MCTSSKSWTHGRIAINVEKWAIIHNGSLTIMERSPRAVVPENLTPWKLPSYQISTGRAKLPSSSLVSVTTPSIAW
jgi:hypothetical protein